MATILCIETSTRNCSVAISKDGIATAVKEQSSDRYVHAEKLHPFISSILEQNNLRPKDLHAICVSNGPGSYTGLRIGISAAKGLCFGLGIPMIAIDSTRILVEQKTGDSELVLAVLDARRNEVYAQIFDQDKTAITEIEAIELDHHSFQEYREGSILVIGDAAEKTKDLTARSLQVLQSFPSAGDMAVLAEHAYMNQRFVNVAYHEPFYLKDFIAGKPKKLL